MCGDDSDPATVADRSSLTRRFPAAASSLAAVAALPGRAWGSTAPAGAAERDAGGGLRRHLAVLDGHAHPFRLQRAGRLDGGSPAEAQLNAVDVIWWTDHDHRMEAGGYRKTVHFTSLTAEQPAAGEGKPWQWVEERSGRLSAQSAGGIVDSPPRPATRSRPAACTCRPRAPERPRPPCATPPSRTTPAGTTRAASSARRCSWRCCPRRVAHGLPRGDGQQRRSPGGQRPPGR